METLKAAICHEEELGSLFTWIVGRRYYAATPLKDEPCRCVREPDNPADTNAIAVYGSNGQLGHLPKYEAAYLAPLLDSEAVRVVPHLRGEDDPQGRTAIALVVWTLPNFYAQMFSVRNSSEWLWFRVFTEVWSPRDQITHVAIKEFRDYMRDKVRAGEVSPLTQLFNRMLKTTYTIKLDFELEKVAKEKGAGT